ncbi:hypothetical protein BofuT4_uP159530.1 [Botrytis cinerea T4]|uniref:Uncharacterized protein n=1 Tax=Botryotinia fuckeliana (strain T4) TaxID=999810 RepID=G2YU34_BOTF4|nr:hypothetical protein BofuT4_uP159530.1 [Botrytis cinerea T4]
MAVICAWSGGKEFDGTSYGLSCFVHAQIGRCLLRLERLFPYDCLVGLTLEEAGRRAIQVISLKILRSFLCSERCAICL